ncbi:hypothetical protein DFA_00247 [Cavenderia fasciculata]|uniref:Transmembrane protein n=1 Tax=Cavenderia fasciculata TaxID=261658 RepID=F4PY09_CACFS|nr:uncharacterized protein DFA_00247 [Cavenderia fasciculata]EGG19669.1 hypothetical protein DFA_00247 [Cavenderia fasciculata]|eukprot:XP_004357963.1 hypothetical protein DFA_00247 [Cavenderia fasciculata]
MSSSSSSSLTTTQSLLELVGFKSLTRFDKTALYALYVGLFGSKVRLSIPLCKKLATPTVLGQLLDMAKHQNVVESRSTFYPLTEYQADRVFIYTLSRSIQACLIELIGLILPHFQDINEIPFKKIIKYAGRGGYPVEIMVASKLAGLLLDRPSKEMALLAVQNGVHSLFLKQLRHDQRGEFWKLKVALYRMIIVHLEGEENTRKYFTDPQDLKDALVILNDTNQIRRLYYLKVPHRVMGAQSHNNFREMVFGSLYGLFSGFIYGILRKKFDYNNNNNINNNSSNHSNSNSNSTMSALQYGLILGMSWMALRSIRFISVLHFSLMRRIYTTRYLRLLDVLVLDYPMYVTKYMFIKNYPIVESLYTLLIVGLGLIRQKQNHSMYNIYLESQYYQSYRSKSTLKDYKKPDNNHIDLDINI